MTGIRSKGKDIKPEKMKMKRILLSTGMFFAACGFSFADGFRQFGDFETADSFQKAWQSPLGTWAVSAAKAELSEFNVGSGKFSLLVGIKGSEKPVYPYLEYRFPKEEQDLSSYKILSLDIFNPSNKMVRMQGFFLMRNLDDPEFKVRVFFNMDILPGKNTKKIPLGAEKGIVLHKTAQAGADWKNVEKLQFFFNCPKESFELFFDHIYLGIRPDVQKMTVPMGKVQAVEFENNWAKVPSAWLRLTNISTAAACPTEVKVAYDKTNLYFHFSCKDSDIPSSRKVEQDDPGIWSGDTIEIFLRNSQDDLDTYYQFAFNAAGSRFDSRIVGGLPFPAWNKDWSVSIAAKPKEWTAVVTLPWHIFDFRKEPAPEWELNVFRGNPKAHENTALSPTGGGYHNPEKFLPLELNAPDMNRYFISVESFLADDLSFGKNSAKVVVNARRDGNAVFELRTDEDRSVTAKFLRKGRTVLKLPFFISNSAVRKLKMSIRDDSGQDIADSSLAIRMPPALALKVEVPSYRNNIYFGEEISCIAGHVRVNVPERTMKESSLRLSFEKENGETIRTLSMNPGRNVPYSLEVKTFPEGVYRLRAWLENKEIGKIGTSETMIRKLPFRSNQVYVGKDRFLRVNGEKFFPIGVYPGATKEDLVGLREAGFNTVMFYAGYGKPSVGILDFLDGMNRLDLRAIPIFAHHVQGGKNRTVPEYVPNLLKEQIGVFKDIPNILAYNMLDEPNVFFQSGKEDYNKIYGEMAALDPWHPVQIVQCGEVSMPKAHEDFCDIYEFDFYPGYRKTGCLKSLNSMPLRVRNLRNALAPSKPIWVAFEGYDRVRTWDCFELGRLADYTETRCLFYACMAEGATGFNYWPFEDAANGACLVTHPNWMAIVRNVQEFNTMLPAIFAPVSSKKLEAAGASSDNIHLAVKEKGKYRYIFAAYSGETPVELHFSGTALEKTLSSLQVLGENRNVGVSSAGFRDSFGKYAVHIYTDDPEPPRIVPIKENLAAVEKFEQDFEARNRSSLLHCAYVDEKGSVRVRLTDEKTGKKIEVNRFLPYCILDGIRRTYLYFSRKEAPFTLEVDLKKPIRMNRIVFRAGRNSIPVDFQVSILVNKTWREIASVHGNRQPLSIVDFFPSEVEGIQWKVSAAAGGELFFLDDLEGFLVP